MNDVKRAAPKKRGASKKNAPAKKAAPAKKNTPNKSAASKKKKDNDKRSHLGMAGHLAAMSEFYFRGYNAAIPNVDVGEDLYVVDDVRLVLIPVQVKTGERSTNATADDATEKTAQYNFSKKQLLDAGAPERYFMLVTRRKDHWRFALLSRSALLQLRRDAEAADAAAKSAIGILEQHHAARLITGPRPVTRRQM